MDLILRAFTVLARFSLEAIKVEALENLEGKWSSALD